MIVEREIMNPKIPRALRNSAQLQRFAKEVPQFATAELKGTCRAGNRPQGSIAQDFGVVAARKPRLPNLLANHA